MASEEEPLMHGKCHMDTIDMEKHEQVLQIIQKRKRDDDMEKHEQVLQIIQKRKRDDDGNDDDQQNQNSSSQYPPWAYGLPKEMIEAILEKLPLDSYGYFSGVCRPWKQIAMKQYLQPYLCCLPCNRWLCDPWMMNVHNFKSMYIRHPFLDDSYCVGSYRGWVLLRDKQSCKVFVMNLFNGARFQLPNWNPRLFSGSIFLSSSPVSGNCTALVIGRYISGIAYCKLGDSECSKFKYKHLFIPTSSNGVREYLDQAVALGEKFYVLTSFGRLLCIDDIHNRGIISIVGANKAVPKRGVFRYFPYLMESEGEILLVFVCISWKICFLDHVEVFRFDFESAAWVPVEKMNGRTLYVGFNCSFAVRTQKDCVFFVDNTSDGWRVYDMEKKKVVEVMHFYSDGHYHSTDLVWVLPTLESPAAPV